MKILDRYILLTYLKTFFVVLILLTIIMVFQTVWLYISELAGKDLSYWVIGRFLLYFTPSLMPLILPLTILVTSVMTFGAFAENYEFAAMKSAGISLQRAMRGLIIFILLIGWLAFFFANNIIPLAEYKSINLRKNIAQLEPAMAIVEGAFNDLTDNFNIKVEKKSGENDQFLHDIIIHKKPAAGRGDYTVIKAKHGELQGSTESNILSLVLYDGNYYNDIYKKKFSERKKEPFAKSYFEEYTINIDLSGFNDVDLGDENYTNSRKMLKINELKIEIDSLSKDLNKDMQNLKQSVYIRNGFAALFPKTNTANLTKKLKKPFDTLKVEEAKEIEVSEDILAGFDNAKKRLILNTAMGSLNNLISTITSKERNFKQKNENLNKYEISLHNKYVIGVASVILFFVGAPLGAIIRKGGVGLPLVVAVLLFLTYHFIGVFARNSAENGAIEPWIACWLSTAIMLPLGIYLTYRATTDQGFFNTDGFLQPFKRLLQKLGIVKKEEAENE